MEIVTGSTGEVHVTPIDDAVRNSNIGYLTDKVVFTCFRNFEATAITNNEVRIYSGYGMNQGRIFKIDDNEWDSVTIENGSQGYKRADLIVARYTMNTQTGFEDISLAAIRGNSGTSYVDPAYSTGNINEGATTDDFPLYRVRLNGLNIEGIDQLFTLVPDGGRLGELEEKVNAHKTAFDALNVRTNLASENNVFLKDGANARPGVEGILPASHGGTGKATLKDGATDLIGALDTNGITPTNDEYYIGTTPNTNGFQRKPLGALWSWISSKLGTMGYGDMTKGDFCDNPDSEVPTIKIARGGTGATTVAGARNALGLGNTAGALPIANGGTGSIDGTINGVKLASQSTQSDKYGYMNGDTFVPFNSIKVSKKYVGISLIGAHAQKSGRYGLTGEPLALQGYTPIGIVGWEYDKQGAALDVCHIQEGLLEIYVSNNTSAELTVTLVINILWIKTS